MSFDIAFNPPQFDEAYDGTKMRQFVEEIERLHAILTADTDDEGVVAEVTSFNTRTGDVLPEQADYDSFFLTPAEGNSAYAPFSHTHSQYATLSALASIVTGDASGASLIGVASLAGSTNTQLQHSLNNLHSAGHISGGEIAASATANAVDVAAGYGYIRATDGEHVEVVNFNWPASSAINIPDGTVRYIGVEYNAGSPQIVVKVTDTWNHNTEFPLGIANNEGGVRHVTNIPWHTGDTSNHLIEYIDATSIIFRDERQSGLILGETGTRNIQITAGNLMSRMSQFPITAFDSSVTDSFTTVYRDGVGGHTEPAAVTQWPNLQYDDGSGTLATLNTNKYASLWFYLAVDEHVYCVYGTEEHPNLAIAQQEAPPTDLPVRFPRHTILIGRLTFREGEATAAAISTAFDTVFNVASVTDHGALSGLTDDDHAQYLLADGT